MAHCDAFIVNDICQFDANLLTTLKDIIKRQFVYFL